MIYTQFSVLISTYKNDDPLLFDLSFKSILNQSLPPTEIVLVIDGFIGPDLEKVICNYQNLYSASIKICRKEINSGLGNALEYGLQYCSYELVARMDTDDVAEYERFQKQINFYNKHPETSVLGGWMMEFQKTPGDIISKKTVPIENDKIKSYAKMRNPLNHPTVMFKKSDIIKAGSYKEINLFEDYYLWLRVLKNGGIISNVDDILLYFRTGNGLIERRHGYQYMLKEFKFFTRCFKEDLIPLQTYLLQISTRLPLRVMPKNLLKLIYKNFLRKTNPSS